MVPRKPDASQFRRNFTLLLLLLFAGGAVVVFRTNVIGSFGPERPTYDKQLLAGVTIGGLIKPDALKLSSSEIRRLNIAILSHRDVFPCLDMTLNPASKRADARIGKTTPLNLTLIFKTDGESEVYCWERTVKRRDLVPHVVRSMERAKALYTHYLQQMGRTRSIKRLYL